ncbi:type II secretion system protein [bacterium]|nr:type II secretion system protein [bacterium]
MKKKGFTLIELMIVISIVGILTAIAFPYFAGAKKRAALESCKINLKSISDALQFYTNDSRLNDMNNLTLNPQNNFLVSAGYLAGNLKCPVSSGYYILNYTDSSKLYSILCPFPNRHYHFPVKQCTKVAYNSLAGYDIR